LLLTPRRGAAHLESQVIEVSTLIALGVDRTGVRRIRLTPKKRAPQVRDNSLD